MDIVVHLIPSMSDFLEQTWLAWWIFAVPAILYWFASQEAPGDDAEVERLKSDARAESKHPS